MLILASNSPRRRQLIALGGWTYQVIPVKVDERLKPGEAPDDYVLRLARKKARSAAQRAPQGSLVIAADTAVVNNAQILGKPSSYAHAADMLRGLCGHYHQVFTGLAVMQVDSGKLITEKCVTEVLMRAYSEAEIQAYVASGDPLDKAGAYAIQHSGFNPVERLEGCFTNVVGLPLCHLTPMLREFGLEPPDDLTRECRSSPGYHCQLSALVRGGI
jgi:MAF protein